MYNGCDFNPILIFEDQCACSRKAQVEYERRQKEAAAARATALIKDQEHFLTLFEPRAE